MRASAAKRGRNPRFPYIAVVIRDDGSTHNTNTKRAFATRQEALFYAEQTCRSTTMNAERRKLLTDAESLLDQARTLIEQARDEEQEAYDNMPEGLQNGDRGTAMSDAIDNLETAASSIEDVVSNVADARGEG
jgi:hypothetical protein